MMETKAVINRPRWFQNPLLLPLIAAVAGTPLLSHALGMTGTLYFIVLIQVVFFLLLFRRPVWAAASLIIGQLMMPNYLFAIFGTEVSLRLIWTILALVLLLPVLKKQGTIKLGSGARRIITPAVIFCLIVTVSNFVSSDLSYVIKDLRTIASWLVILCVIPAVVKNEGDLKFLVVVTLIAGSVSAAVAVMQHYSFIGLPAFILTPASWDGDRTPGLSENPVSLAVYLPLILVPMVSMYLLKSVGPDKRKFLPFLALINTAALFFTATRSGMYSLVPGFLSILFLLKGRARIRLLVILLIFGVVFLGYSGLRQNRYSEGFNQETSAAFRLVAWQAGMNIALDNPILGAGHEKFLDMSREYASTVNAALMENQGIGGALGSTQVHNDFIGVWAWYGTFALLAYLVLYVNIFRNFLGAYRHAQTRFLKGLAIGCFGAMATYILNAATHNVLDSSTLIWIMGGLSIAVAQISLQKRNTGTEEARLPQIENSKMLSCGEKGSR